MHLKLETYDSFRSSKNSDELWSKLHSSLAPFDVTSIFYGIMHLPELLMMDGVINAGTDAFHFKTSYTQDISDKMPSRYNISDDLSAIHCMSSTEPFFWHSHSALVSNKERKRRETASPFWHNLQLNGVSIPLRFSGCGKGGFGMCMGKLTVAEFDELWLKKQDEITSIVYIFDEIARSNFSCLVGLKLTPREKDIISWLSQGGSAKVIAGRLGITVNTVQNQISSARNKLGAANNVQLVAKALTFKLI